MTQDNLRPQTGLLKDKVNLLLGKNGMRILIILPVLEIIFLYMYDHLGSLYGYLLISLLGDIGIGATLSAEQLGGELGIFAGLTEHFINLSDSLFIPILMIQKLQFVIIMLSIVLGLHISAQKKMRYLMAIPAYWGFVMAVDLISILSIYAFEIEVDMYAFGALVLVLISYVGSVILLHLVLTTARLPAPVNVKPKVKQDQRKYYYALGVALVLTILVLYVLSTFVLIPAAQHIQYNVSIAMLSLVFLHLFRILTLSVGYAFSSLDKPMRSTTYTPMLSVLIPAYNEEKQIARSIKSVDASASLYKGEVELIVIDDRSTDRTYKVSEETIGSCRHLRGKVITGEGKGKSAALNLGTSHALGELVFNIDADTTITKDAIREVVPYFADPTVGGVGLHAHQRDERGLLRKLFTIELLFTFGLVRPAQQGFDSVMVLAGLVVMYRKSIIQELGGWAMISSGEDGDMTIRVGRYGYKIIQYKKKPLGFSQIPPDFTPWFIQRSRWMRAFFFTHARNRTAVSMRQGIRGKFLMPFIYARMYNSFTSLLHVEIILLMATLSVVQYGLMDLQMIRSVAIFPLPFVIILFFLAVYYRKTSIIPFAVFYPIYRYLNMICSFRSLISVMGDESWETKAAVDNRGFTLYRSTHKR